MSLNGGIKSHAYEVVNVGVTLPIEFVNASFFGINRPLVLASEIEMGFEVDRLEIMEQGSISNLAQGALDRGDRATQSNLAALNILRCFLIEIEQMGDRGEPIGFVGVTILEPGQGVRAVTARVRFLKRSPEVSVMREAEGRRRLGSIVKA